MTSGLEPYAEYKDSGVPWLGEIPAHWEMERAKWLFEEMQRPVRPVDETVTCFRDGTVTLRSNRRTSGFTESLKEIGYQGVRPGDLVIHAMDAFAGAVGVSDSAGKCSPVYAVCQPKSELKTHFYAYLVREMSRSQYIAALSRGIRQRSTDFRFATFADQRLPVPPYREQESMVACLLHIDRLTRRYIRAQRRLIERLEEQKQAVVQRAVTRGLDPDVPLRHSGIDRLAEIPARWDVCRAKQIGSLLVSNVDKHTLPEEEPVRLCNYTDVYYNDYITDELDFMKASATQDEIERFRLRAGDVILTKDSETWDDIGVPALVRYQAPDLLCGYHLAILRPDPTHVSGEFLMRCLQSPVIATQLHIAANGITRYGLSQQAIKDVLLPVPPLSEQESVTRAIGQTVSALMTTIARAQRQIDLVREYRTRLIADVVTGKLDVRGVPLPDLDPGDDGDDLDDWQQLEMLDNVEEEQATE